MVYTDVANNVEVGDSFYFVNFSINSAYVDLLSLFFLNKGFI